MTVTIRVLLIKGNLGGPSYDYSPGNKRLKGYQMALEELGIEVPDSYIQQMEFSFQGGYEGMKKIYEESSLLPTAVVAGSDLIAIGGVQYLSSQGVKVPDEISGVRHRYQA